MIDILEELCARRRQDAALRERSESFAALTARAQAMPPPPDFAAAFAGRGLHVIAELKKASPSEGLIRADFDPPALARELAAGGADALSVLCEPHRFLGSEAYLREVVAALADDAAKTGTKPIPVLYKDFVTTPYQVAAARAAGASAVLLIAAVLDDVALRALLAFARALGFAALVETHDADEIRRAVAAGARIVGVNCRDLRTFKTDPAIVERFIGRIPSDRVRIAESGIRTADDMKRLAAAGADGFLVGTTLMRDPSPGNCLKQFNLKTAVGIFNTEAQRHKGTEFCRSSTFSPFHSSAFQATFVRCKAEGRAAYVAYLALGAPTRRDCVRAADVLVGEGADILELGLPCENPFADGPTIASAIAQARANGVTAAAALADVAVVRARHPDVPIVVLAYRETIAAFGVVRFAEKVADSGADGVLPIGLHNGERTELLAALRHRGLTLVPLLLAEDDPSMVRQLADGLSDSFLYAVTRPGVTGAAVSPSDALRGRLAAIRRETRIPVVAGFGIRTPADGAEISAGCDGFVIGSANVKRFMREGEKMTIPAIKVCGVNDASLAAEAERLGADYLGFIFAEGSPRRVGVLDVVRIRAHLSGRARCVGVFTTAAVPEILNAVRACGLDVVQLHRRATAADVAAFRAAGLEVWTLAGGAAGDAVLFDSSHGDGEARPSSRFMRLKGGCVRVVLAGGVSAENLSAFFAQNPDVIDVSGSLETSPGVKSVGLVRAFFARWQAITAAACLRMP